MKLSQKVYRFSSERKIENIEELLVCINDKVTETTIKQLFYSYKVKERSLVGYSILEKLELIDGEFVTPKGNRISFVKNDGREGIKFKIETVINNWFQMNNKSINDEQLASYIALIDPKSYDFEEKSDEEKDEPDYSEKDIIEPNPEYTGESSEEESVKDIIAESDLNEDLPKKEEFIKEPEYEKFARPFRERGFKEFIDEDKSYTLFFKEDEDPEFVKIKEGGDIEVHNVTKIMPKGKDLITYEFEDEKENYITVELNFKSSTIKIK